MYKYILYILHIIYYILYIIYHIYITLTCINQLLSGMTLVLTRWWNLGYNEKAASVLLSASFTINDGDRRLFGVNLAEKSHQCPLINLLNHAFELVVQKVSLQFVRFGILGFVKCLFKRCRWRVRVRGKNAGYRALFPSIWMGKIIVNHGTSMTKPGAWTVFFARI